TTSQAAPNSAGLAHATAPEAANDCTTSARTSHTRTGKPARSSDLATPPPMEPSPMTPTMGLFMRPTRSWPRTTHAIIVHGAADRLPCPSTETVCQWARRWRHDLVPLFEERERAVPALARQGHNGHDIAAIELCS